MVTARELSSMNIIELKEYRYNNIDELTSEELTIIAVQIKSLREKNKSFINRLVHSKIFNLAVQAGGNPVENMVRIREYVINPLSSKDLKEIKLS